MYVLKKTYGGIDYHDSYTRMEQMTFNGGFDISKDDIPAVIANDIAERFPYVNGLKENIMKAIADKSKFNFLLKTGECDHEGNVIAYRDGDTHEEDGVIYNENEAAFDGENMSLLQDYLYGQVSYNTEYYVEDIFDEEVGYIVTEDFPAPAKGVPLVQRLYHDVFLTLDEARAYMKSMKPHDIKYPKPILNLTVCNRCSISQESKDWYEKEKTCMRLMEEAGEDCLGDSFSIFTDKHIQNLTKKIENLRQTRR